MGLTLSNTNYNGDVLAMLYEVLSTGFMTKQKGLLRTETEIDSKRALPKITGADDVLTDYTTGVPGADSASITYSERDLEVKKATMYLTFTPQQFETIWKVWRSVNNYTNLELNPELVRAILSVLGNRLGNQLDRLVWQGDTAAGAASPLRFFDGFIKLANADGNVINPTPAGVITTANVFDIVFANWNAIPEHLLDDPNVKMVMSTTDWKLLQQANITAKKTTVGVLNQTIEELFVNKRIVHVSGMPKNYIYTSKMTMDEMTNNFFGVWFDPDDEFSSVRIDRVNNAGHEMFMRVDFKMGVNHREGSEVVLYKPA